MLRSVVLLQTVAWWVNLHGYEIAHVSMYENTICKRISLRLHHLYEFAQAVLGLAWAQGRVGVEPRRALFGRRALPFWCALLVSCAHG